MKFLQSLSWFRSPPSQIRSKKPTRKLWMEVLEDRTVPAVLTVNQSGVGATFTSIQAAVDASSNGDTIQVSPGLYQEHVVVNKSVTLSGPQAGVQGTLHNGGEAVVDGTSNGAPFQVTASNVTIDGFTIMNGANPVVTQPSSGVALDVSTANINIVNNIINNNTTGIYVNGTNILIQGNVIENNKLTGPTGGSGIYSDQGSANVTIADNRFLNDLNGAITFGLLPITIRANSADPLRNSNLLVTRNSFQDINLGSFADITNGTISFNSLHATDQFSNIGIQGGVIGLNILGNDLSGGTRGVRIVGSDRGIRSGAEYRRGHFDRESIFQSFGRGHRS